ncbi:hypothetical protein AN478_02510 [Thiohalorhabdus denitrificans]|uniref:DUF2066 domain-containing protein n=1 Tax=Thiohalorhabdus denitrificans TaxID=381306 RepID=A0A0P9C872_9GAMM|nr:DUF2066 domain-containing protein [Thiohalorhabdus denitrificans]KPV41460.1 hypothetical protein AN478_02510 [Thiohalorhabdus denitrificans]SCY28342.1 hypothetical protein SAMN05661077_1701 [Thiohalorhabdus denitrificans]
MHSFPRRIMLGLLALLLGALAGPVPAAQVENLYQAVVDKEDLDLLETDGGQGSSLAGDGGRRALMRAALARVLIRLSGTSEVVADSQVRAALLEPVQDFVSRYQVLRGDSSGTRLRVRFSEQAVREGLWEQGWPVWGRYRPGVVVWVARRGTGSRNPISPDREPALFDALEAAAEQYGLPLLVPLMDGTDRDRISGRDLLFEDWERIKTASERYDPDAILVVRVGEGERSGTRVDWVLRRGGEDRTFSSSADGLEGALQRGMERLLAGMARDYAVEPGRGVPMEAAVEGVRTLEELAQVERGLGRLAAIDAVMPARTVGSEARFRFRFRADPERAAHIVSLLDILEPEERDSRAAEPGDRQDAEEDGSALLHFTYRP